MKYFAQIYNICAFFLFREGANDSIQPFYIIRFLKNPVYKFVFFFMLFAAAGIVLLSGCKKDDYSTSPDLRLSFSTDSIMFDTVFTTVGSATQWLKVYNNADSYVRINRIKLSNDPNNSYRMNVDGISGTDLHDIEIGPKDSIFIFIEVTVTPGQNALYPFVDGSIDFTTNGNEQKVNLVAWGWDAIFYTPTVFPTNGLPDFTLIDNANPNATVTWTDEKPIVVYGYLVVDSLQTLIVEPGTQVFFHQGAGLWIYRDGNIKAEGTLEKPIVFQGDRLESFYEEQPGQWDRIWINENNNASKNNVFKNVLIKNNFIGIQCETLPFNNPTDPGLSTNTLKLDNVVIRNNSIASIYSKNYQIDANNVSLSSGGQYLLAGTGAGRYNFDQCTFANNWTYGTRQTPSLYLTNLLAVSSTEVKEYSIETCEFRNCIIYGNGINELGFDFQIDDSSIHVNLALKNCLIRGEEEVLQEFSSYLVGTNYVGQNPGFINFSDGDFHLLLDAFARDKGGNGIGLPQSDLDGVQYSSPRPVGCFTFVE